MYMLSLYEVLLLGFAFHEIDQHGRLSVNAMLHIQRTVDKSGLDQDGIMVSKRVKQLPHVGAQY
jgi:hypothetical protein